MLDCFASERHYLDHLWPIACNVEGARMVCATTELRRYAERKGIEARASTWPPALLVGAPRSESGPPVLVAGFRDAGRVHKRRPLALLEHGAGQTYRGFERDPHYAGGDGWGRASLILSPGPHAASRWMRRRADDRSASPPPILQLQGSPRLDAWAAWRLPLIAPPPASLEATATDRMGRAVKIGVGATRATPIKELPVVVSFHWDSRLCPETRSSWRVWLQAVRQLAAERPVLGHAHPRLWRELAPVWSRYGIEATPSWEDCLARGWLFCCDNSSTMFEWAGLGRPVLALNQPRYRRDVEHGLRFWSHVPGLEADFPEQLAERVEEALEDPPEARERRREACMAAYGRPEFDGCSLERALAGIREFAAGES